MHAGASSTHTHSDDPAYHLASQLLAKPEITKARCLRDSATDFLQLALVLPSSLLSSVQFPPQPRWKQVGKKRAESSCSTSGTTTTRAAQYSAVSPTKPTGPRLQT